MIPQDDIDRLEAENPPLKLAKEYGLDIKQQGNAQVSQCPFHLEKSPSFTIYDDHFHCFGCGWHGKPIAFVMKLEGISFPDAFRRLGGGDAWTESEATRLKRAEERRQQLLEAEANRRREKEAQRANWPTLYEGRTHDLWEVATLRGIGYAGPWLAQELGHLRFATWRNQLAWIIGNDFGGRARRLDGQLWPHGNPHKSDHLSGSDIQCVGLTDSSLPVMIVEGEGDYLTALAWLWETGRHEDWDVVCMFGSTSKLGCAAKKLHGREVIIYAHSGLAGLKGAKRWQSEAIRHGAKEAPIPQLPPGRDLNDLYREGALS